MMLAGLGADVVLVEPPGGSPGRRVGPFAGDEPGPDRSLTFWAENRGKRSVVADLTDPDDRRRLLDLVDGADVLVESGAPGELAAPRPRLRRARGAQPGPGRGLRHPLRSGRAEGGLGRLRPHALRGVGRADPDRGPRPAAATGERAPGLDARRHDRGRRRAAGAARTGGVRSGPARGRRRPGGGDPPQRGPEPGRAGPSHAGCPGRRRRELRRAEDPHGVGRPGRPRLDHPHVRHLLRPLHPPPHGVGARRGLLRRGHPRQGLDRLRRGARHRRGAR